MVVLKIFLDCSVEYDLFQFCTSMNPILAMNCVFIGSGPIFIIRFAVTAFK